MAAGVPLSGVDWGDPTVPKRSKSVSMRSSFLVDGALGACFSALGGGAFFSDFGAAFVAGGIFDAFAFGCAGSGFTGVLCFFAKNNLLELKVQRAVSN